MQSTLVCRFASTLALLLAMPIAPASGAVLPATLESQVVFNFDATSVFDRFGSFVLVAFNVRDASFGSQLSYSLYTEPNGVGLEASGTLFVNSAGTRTVNFTDVQAPIDGLFSVGVYAPAGSIDLAPSLIARLTALNGRVVFLDSAVSAVPETSTMLSMALGLGLVLTAHRFRGSSGARSLGKDTSA